MHGSRQDVRREGWPWYDQGRHIFLLTNSLRSAIRFEVGMEAGARQDLLAQALDRLQFQIELRAALPAV